MINTTQSNRHGEQGNAFFLILVAVVLFAALAYAIIQSNRSSGSSSNETNLIASSTVTQYPSAIRTGITRMMLRGGSLANLQFHDPVNYGDTPANEVFHPSGGGVAYQNVDPNTVTSVIPTSGGAGNPTSNWYFLKDKVITNVGSPAGDAVAVLVRVKTGICQQINQQLTGSTDIPASNLTEKQIITEGANPLTGPKIDGQPFLCVSLSGGGNAYYHVLVEQ